MAMKSVRDPARRAEELAAALKNVEAFNAKYSSLGFCTAYTAFDTVFTKLCMYTDDLEPLKAMLSTALTNQPCSDKS